uniref:Uncharacterized protein n=1 Tax=Anguilla anguilla TaxID=7936 RepID=A0A0E9Q7Z4_ANGAN
MKVLSRRTLRYLCGFYCRLKRSSLLQKLFDRCLHSHTLIHLGFIC